MTEHTNYPLQKGMESILALPTESQVREFERGFGFELPSDYRTFLLQRNAIRFKPHKDTSLCYPIRQRWEEERKRAPRLYPRFHWPPKGDVFSDLVGFPSRLLGIGSGDHSLKPLNPAYGFSAKMPREFLVIGFTTINDIICLGCGTNLRGHVLHWNTLMGQMEFTQKDAMTGLKIASRDFRQFWEDLLPLAEDRIVR